MKTPAHISLTAYAGVGFRDDTESKCICTGIVLQHPTTGKAYNGDLFQQGDTFIVNCNPNSEHDFQPTAQMRWIRPRKDWWHRRGVWVFPAVNCLLSGAALDYIA